MATAANVVYIWQPVHKISLVHPEDGETAPSETSVPLYKIARCPFYPEDGSNLHRIVSNCTTPHGVTFQKTSVFNNAVEALISPVQKIVKECE